MQKGGKSAKGVKRQTRTNNNTRYGKALETWDEELFLHLCKDRGYQQRVTVVYYLAQELGKSIDTVSAMLSTGKFKWEEILFIGAYFEMTTKEFCDIFLSGFFKERNGRFVCHLDNPEEILQRTTNKSPTNAEREERKKQKIKEELEKMG